MKPQTLPERSTFHAPRSSPAIWAGFTLIELLIVISIIAILAAMIIPISGAVSRNKIRAKARVELEQVATAIELYKAKLGHYPPDNPRYPSTNQLYFELFGTTLTNINGKNIYVTLDGSARVAALSVPTLFGGTGGFINTIQGTGGDESRSPEAFLHTTRPDETSIIKSSSDELVKILVAGVPAPSGWVNPIAYVSSNPTNNPNSYDLWVDIVISGKTNRLSNWNKEPMILQ